ncbi:hypothetical protein AK830_g8633 [Neonectria ditissima]|uniref:Ig-like domain-containing protein n=1 Tax=Neonectria ditissima TaxID=78410 RepID=A0A0N8H642_9HYPO|nr:hypothetical protein AK830_g8633 [Neonectria ditissima]
MLPLLTLASLLSAVAAVEVKVIWRHEKSTNRTSLSAYNREKGSLIAETCGSFLDGDSPIDFSNVDEHGSGNFTVGDDTYKVHSKARHSGGPECSRSFNKDHAWLQCSGFEWDSTNATQGNNSYCFENSRSHTVFRTLEGRDKDHGEKATRGRGLVEPRSEGEKSMDKRLGGTCVSGRTTKLVGDGNPHQNYYLEQLSETINCGSADSCSVGESQSQSITVGFSVSATLWEWLTGGFDVSVSWTTGNTYTCTADAGETVCIWYNTAHTAYTVQNADSGPCLNSPVGDSFVLYSPNANNDGGGYYCVVGTCRSQTNGYWNYDGPAGGPP